MPARAAPENRPRYSSEGGFAVSAAPKPARFDNIGEILNELGVAARRVRAVPPPGKATEKDVIAIHDRTGRLYELVDGVLVEKVMSFPSQC